MADSPTRASGGMGMTLSAPHDEGGTSSSSQGDNPFEMEETGVQFSGGEEGGKKHK